MKYRVEIGACHLQLRDEWKKSNVHYFQHFVQNEYKGRLRIESYNMYLDFDTEADRNWFLLKFL